MYNEQIENLINLALADGELTEKEKQILFKKAEDAGIDLDEFEMVLDARLFEKQQSKKEIGPTTSAAPKSDKFGDIKKCPACAAMVQSFQTKCSDCGHDFQNVDANISIQKLFKMLTDVENSRTESNSSFFGKLQATLGVSDVDKKKIEIISSFPIPNSKNDMLEFLSLALPKSKIKKNLFGGESQTTDNKLPNMYARAWKDKCEQIVMKARFSMKEDKKTLEEINSYANELGIK